MTTASTYKQRQDIIQGVPCLNCGQVRWAREGDDCVRCQECERVFKVRTLWAEMSDLPVTQPAEPEVHLEHPEFATLVVEYALLDQAERLDDIDAGSSTLFDRGQRLQRLEDVLPADVCAAIQLLNERCVHTGGFSNGEDDDPEERDERREPGFQWLIHGQAKSPRNHTGQPDQAVR